MEGGLRTPAPSLPAGVGANQAALLSACLAADPAAVRSALGDGASPEAQAPGEWAALHLAALSGNGACVQLLLWRGAPPNQRAADGWTALLCACRTGQATAVRLLAKNGASLEARLEGGAREGALHLAAARGHASVVLALLELGADPEARTAGEAGAWTALHYGARAGADDVCGALLHARPGLAEMRSAAGETAAVLAARTGHARTM
ncbi:ankyrin repeat-containing domain protein, partial [Pavlovales sp. CCMP2436]